MRRADFTVLRPKRYCWCDRIGRSRLELPPRKCLLCGEAAKVCARGRRHSMEELLAEIRRILDEAGL